MGSSGHLFGGEVGHGCVRDVVGLQAELRQVGEELGDSGDGIVRHVDAVADAEGGEAGVEAGPEAGLREVVAARQLQVHETLHLLQHHLGQNRGLSAPAHFTLSVHNSTAVLYFLPLYPILTS